MAKLDIKETQRAIKKIKDYFENELAEKLNLIRVSSPLLVTKSSGLNDNLSGKEKPVSFKLGKYDKKVEIVQSLAKWKRVALKVYNFDEYEGLYTDMNAIRPDEILDNTHSLYVDQWDWEKIIKREDRNEEYLKKIVEDIFEVFKNTERYINSIYPFLEEKLPDKIFFIDSQELENKYPSKESKEREYLITKEYGAVFIMKIGERLATGKPHDYRAPDYDDWKLNGDILFYSPILDEALELSSMGIRVDKESLAKQLKEAKVEERMDLNYCKLLMEEKLPFTIGGGIGQSRICMYFLEKKHIGEVQASVWPKDLLNQWEKENLFLL